MQFIAASMDTKYYKMLQFLFRHEIGVFCTLDWELTGYYYPVYCYLVI